MVKKSESKSKDNQYYFIKELIEDSIKPLVRTTCEHHTVLNGKDGRNGLIKDVNNLKLGIGLIKWFIALQFTILTFLFTFLFSFWKFLKGIV